MSKTGWIDHLLAGVNDDNRHDLIGAGERGTEKT
jgi:hypothetical protein